MPSPVRLTTRPWWTAIVGSIRSLRSARSRASVRSSSAPARRLKPTTSAARIAASLRVSVIATLFGVRIAHLGAFAILAASPSPPAQGGSCAHRWSPGNGGTQPALRRPSAVCYLRNTSIREVVSAQEARCRTVRRTGKFDPKPPLLGRSECGETLRKLPRRRPRAHMGWRLLYRRRSLSPNPANMVHCP